MGSQQKAEGSDFVRNTSLLKVSPQRLVQHPEPCGREHSLLLCENECSFNAPSVPLDMSGTGGWWLVWWEEDERSDKRALVVQAIASSWEGLRKGPATWRLHSPAGGWPNAPWYRTRKEHASVAAVAQDGCPTSPGLDAWLWHCVGRTVLAPAVLSAIAEVCEPNSDYSLPTPHFGGLEAHLMVVYEGLSGRREGGCAIISRPSYSASSCVVRRYQPVCIKVPDMCGH